VAGSHDSNESVKDAHICSGFEVGSTLTLKIFVAT